MEISAQFLVKEDQTRLQRWSLAAIILMAILSIIGFIWPQSLYPGEGQADAYRVNDLINLIVGLPGALLAFLLVKHGKRLGLLFLPGVMLFIFYTYIAYLFGITFSGWSILWGILAIGSGILFFRLAQNLNAALLKHSLNGKAPALFSGIVLVIFGLGFGGLAVDLIRTNPLSLPHPDLGLAIADISVSLLWFIGGILLLFKKPIGFSTGLGLLYTGVLLFVGIILLVIVRPFLTSLPFVFADLAVLLVMALVCFIPFGLFVRSVLKLNNPE